MKNIEQRTISLSLRTADDAKRTVQGTAVVFDQPSRDIGFTEYIHRGAITDDTIKDSDVFALLNHDEEKKLARSNHGKGSLHLSVDENGVNYSFRAKNNDLGNSLLEFINDGELTESSFAFTVAEEPDAEKWTRNSDGTYRRDIYKIDHLYDISPCWTAAYPTTSVSTRSFENIKAKAEKVDASLEKILNEIENW